MAKQTHKRYEGPTLDNLVESIPLRISAVKERINLDLEAERNAVQAWAERGEKYNALSFWLGRNAYNFLSGYVAKLWPKIEELLIDSGKAVFQVDALKRKFMCEQPHLSFARNSDSLSIMFYPGFRSGSSDYKPENISLGILEKDPKNKQNLGEILLSENYFYGNACYSKWDKTVDNAPKLPSKLEVQELYNEFTNCVLSNTSEVLDKLMAESLRK